MGLLASPFPSRCGPPWRIVASGFGRFFVQERAEAGGAASKPTGHPPSPDEDDGRSFRIVHIGGSTAVGAAEGEGACSVVAVDRSLAAIFTDWAWLLQAWPAVHGTGSSGKAVAAVATLSEDDWRLVYMYISRPDGQRTTPPSRPPPVAAGVTQQLSSTSGGTSGAYFNLYDAAVLQLCDLFTWQSPPLTLLVMLAIAFGRLALVHLGLCQGGAAAAVPLLPWPAVLCTLLCVSLPLNDAQTHRRRVVFAWDSPPSPPTAGAEAAVRWAEARVLTERVALDKERLKTLAKLTAMKEGGGQRTHDHRPPEKKKNGGGWLPFGLLSIGLIALFLLQFVLSLFAPRWTPHATLNVVTGPAVMAAFIVNGILKLRSTVMRRSPTTATTAAASHEEVETLKTVGAADGEVGATAASANTLPQRPDTATVAVTPPRVAATTEASTPPDASAASAESGTTMGPSVSGALDSSYKYRLPALTDKENAVLQQLMNYEAPFSMIVLKPIREWNQTQGWETQWERDGLRCEEKLGRGDALTIRFTANIPNANVGTLQAILLDDPDFLDTKSTFVYQYSPLLSQRCVVKRLAYNMAILLTRHRSPVFGVPPLELLHYLSPAVLLDPEQQEALKLRRPFARLPPNGEGGGRHTTEVEVPLDERGQPKKLLTFLQCSIPCPADLHPTPPCQPPHVRGATELMLVMGMEEADGSLTLGVYTSCNSKGLIPKDWESVFRSSAVHRASKIAKLLGQEGPQLNKLAVYANTRGFQPYLDRQALSEPEPQTPKHRAATPSREAPFYSSGNALFTADMEAAMPSPTKTHQPTFPSPVTSGVAERGTHPSAAAALGHSPSVGSLVPEQRLPKLPQRFVEELLTLPNWTPEGGHTRNGSEDGGSGNGGVGRSGVQCWSCPTPFAPHKAAASLIFVPGVSLALTEAVLLVERLFQQLNPLMERVVTVTPANLPGLLIGAAVTAPSGGGAGSEPAKLPSPDFPRESYHGCSIVYSQYRSPMWGVAARDTVTRVAEPYYFTAGDARRVLFTPSQLRALPEEFRELADTTRVLLFCGEDASEVLPPMKQYQRATMHLFGFLCWEQSRPQATEGHEGVSILVVSVSDMGGGLLGKLADRSVQDQQQLAVRMKEILQKMSTGGTKGRWP